MVEIPDPKGGVLRAIERRIESMEHVREQLERREHAVARLAQRAEGFTTLAWSAEASARVIEALERGRLNLVRRVEGMTAAGITIVEPLVGATLDPRAGGGRGGVVIKAEPVSVKIGVKEVKVTVSAEVAAPRHGFDRVLKLAGYALTGNAQRVFEPVCEEIRQQYLETRRERSKPVRAWLMMCFGYRASRDFLKCFLCDHIPLLATIGSVVALLWWLWLIGT